MNKPYRKIIITLILLLGTFNTAYANVGKYFNKANGSEFIELQQDNNFILYELGVMTKGKYNIKNSNLILTIIYNNKNISITAILDNDTIKDKQGKIWVKSDRAPPDIRAVVTEQDSQGLTDENLNSASLNIFKEWIVDLASTTLKLLYRTKKDVKSQILVDAKYIMYKKRKLIVADISFTTGAVKIVRVMGIKGKKLMNVACTSISGQNIEIFSGICGDKVKDVFN